MKFNFLKRRKFWWRFLGLMIAIPLLLFGIVLTYIYVKQDDIVQSQISKMNNEHKGKIVVGDSHLSPFENFPYISIKIDDVFIYENKEDNAPVILDVLDIYAGFDIRDILAGNYDIQTLIIEEGFFNLVLHEDGTNNLQNALASTGVEEESDPLNIHLKNIEVNNLDFHKLDEETKTDVEAFIFWGKGGFNSGNGIVAAHVDSEFELNIFNDGDTTYIHDRHFEVQADATHDENSGILTFKPSRILMEHGDFELKGSLDIKNEMNLDLEVNGTKPNFDMFIAFAPVDLIPVLERYKNAGKIYFNAVVQGPTLHGQLPFIDAKFGAEEAFLENTVKSKRINDLGFKGHFTTGENRSLSTMEFSLTDMEAQLERGDFVGSVVVKNFEKPEVDMKMIADFNLEFIGDFLNLTEIGNTSGDVFLEMNFHDIIDIDQPENALNELNRAYFSELKINNLSFSSVDLPAPLERLDAHLIMKGKQATLDQFDLLMGDSDISITGYLSDLPAVIHHTDIPVIAHLEIESEDLNIAELTQFSKTDSTGIDEYIEDLQVGFSFESTAKAFTESLHLPEGEFFVDNLHAQLKHYPHELHDFHVDFLIDERDLKIKDFTGYIDDSDFHFNGMIHDYGFWLKPEQNGDVDLDITLQSDLLRLEDVFSYQGENYVPEEYRHEEFEKLALHVNTSMHYKASALHAIDIDLDRLESKMHIHPMRFEDFRGRIHYEDDHVVLEKFHGKMGRTVFDLDLNYYLGKDEAIKKRDNYLGLKANYIDFDQLTNFNPSPAAPKESNVVKSVSTTDDVAAHAESFNLYELPFTDMKMDLDIGHFIYHRIDLQNIRSNLRTTKDHYIYLDTLGMNAAGGRIDMSGYFNGSDPEHIYLKPNLNVKNVDIDRLLFKFENFGQDYIVSENLHGQLSAKINGNIRVYPDFVPDLDQSEVHMDVLVLNGQLENYDPMLMLSDYMGNKDLTKIRFDTLQNHIDLNQGQMTLPSMQIESTLGHMEISGSQDMENNMEYFVRIPWKTVNQATRSKLFGKKKDKEEEPVEDEIIKVDENKKVRYINLKITGKNDEYKITLGKDKQKTNKK